ncbi:Fur-regulated basic protein FbpA [Aeribacillus pallidus]|uniref:Fur-regulated basic protein FbpA n=1 Tax=Bacillales TaxID=1385 RepID=UPI002E1F4A01|nr:Fur-regulated basic protein FbpA [Aeribacillus composti]MED4488189.1 Fur-regulated basic protein FbpA [Aeribacillus pallidus]
MAVLKEAVEKRRRFLIDWLINHEVYESKDGRQLYELSLGELEHMYIAERIKIGKEMSKID